MRLAQYLIRVSAAASSSTWKPSRNRANHCSVEANRSGSSSSVRTDREPRLRLVVDADLAERLPFLLGIHREGVQVVLDLPAGLGGLRRGQPPQPRAPREFLDSLDPQLPVLAEPEVEEQEPDEGVQHAQPEQDQSAVADVLCPLRLRGQRVEQRDGLVEQEDAAHAGHAHQGRERQRRAEPPEPAEAGRVGCEQQFRLGDVLRGLLVVEQPQRGEFLLRERAEVGRHLRRPAEFGLARRGVRGPGRRPVRGARVARPRCVPRLVRRSESHRRRGWSW